MVSRRGVNTFLAFFARSFCTFFSSASRNGSVNRNKLRVSTACGGLYGWLRDAAGSERSVSAWAPAFAEAASTPLESRLFRVSHGLSAHGMKREAGALCDAQQGRRCPRNGKREHERRRTTVLEHGKVPFGGRGSPRAARESGDRPEALSGVDSRRARPDFVPRRCPARRSAFSPCRRQLIQA